MNFSDRLTETCQRQNSLLCIGLDPDVHKLPASLRAEPKPLFKFCAEIVESTKHTAAAYKPNLAFFEAEGSAGWAQLEKLLETIPSGILTIADGKRGDIGSSSEMYARSILRKLDCDAVTVNPYMGRDSVEPFLQWPEKGAFILCLTSNPGAQNFQHFNNGRQTLYENVIAQVQSWNSSRNCGLVVGATHPEEARAIRSTARHLPFLVPGVGTQGGDLDSAVRNATSDTGGMALFNSSRGIIYKSNGADFADAAAKAAEELRDQINQIRFSIAREPS
ncbi:orotidine-5'-phosphate decarboxylase [bacterium]|nr:orotidine-5'-phosphate decarboxylase [bacterium]